MRKLMKSKRRYICILTCLILFAVSLSGCGGALNYLTGEITATVGSFGTFCVTADVTPPEVSVKIAEGSAVKESSIKCTIRDRLSGIKYFRAEIDGHWVVAPLDGKTATVERPLADARITKGKKHRLKVAVEDNVGNKAVEYRNFTW